ncbi:hypothetical protein D3C72_2239690 [compost metagenome]
MQDFVERRILVDGHAITAVYDARQGAGRVLDEVDASPNGVERKRALDRNLFSGSGAEAEKTTPKLAIGELNGCTAPSIEEAHGNPLRVTT